MAFSDTVPKYKCFGLQHALNITFYGIYVVYHLINLFFHILLHTLIYVLEIIPL